ncbi:MAG: D-alanyl-D-alanine carboxypeptidase family protein [Candidatus Pacebacteria bacterium]|nr:D-alanyl-D-alanine carboxypeptidase family protein [Candidatus Paceibacterota bacterium]
MMTKEEKSIKQATSSTHTPERHPIKDVPPHYWVVAGAFTLVVLLVGFGFWYGHKYITAFSEQISSLSGQIAFLETKLASTTELLKGNIAETHSSLSSELNKEKQNVGALQQQLGSFEQEVGAISGTVTTLEKLSKTDPEFLQKYSKVFFLNEHYAPERLTEIPDEYEYYENKHSKIHSQVWPYLQTMLNQAKQSGVELYIFSAYRSFDEQEALKEQYAVTYGEGTANQFSADQGYSEHQLGTAVDIITTGIGGTLDGFDETSAYQWLLQNAHRYGFILSYPDNNSYYIFEPWHWRFVGVKLATDIHSTGKHFYDLEQREIDEYLVSIFD